MGLVKVWNLNSYPLEEKFKDENIKILPGEFIVMDEDEAQQYKGQYKQVLRTADGGPDPKCYKMLKIEPHGKEEPKKELQHICQACSFVGSSSQELEDHIDEKHLDQLQDAEVADKRRKAKKTA